MSTNKCEPCHCRRIVEHCWKLKGPCKACPAQRQPTSWAQVTFTYKPSHDCAFGHQLVRVQTLYAACPCSFAYLMFGCSSCLGGRPMFTTRHDTLFDLNQSVVLHALRLVHCFWLLLYGDQHGTGRQSTMPQRAAIVKNIPRAPETGVQAVGRGGRGAEATPHNLGVQPWT